MLILVSKLVTEFVVKLYLNHLLIHDDCLVKFANLQYFPLASFARSYRVTDEAFIAET